MPSSPEGRRVAFLRTDQAGGVGKRRGRSDSRPLTKPRQLSEPKTTSATTAKSNSSVSRETEKETDAGIHGEGAHSELCPPFQLGRWFPEATLRPRGVQPASTWVRVDLAALGAARGRGAAPSMNGGLGEEGRAGCLATAGGEPRPSCFRRCCSDGVQLAEPRTRF